MKVLFICAVSPFPKTVGKTVMIGGMSEYFVSSSPRIDLQLMSFDNVPQGYGVTAEDLPKPRLIQKIWNVLLYSIILQRKSIQESLFWCAEAQRKIRDSIAKFKPDLIIYDTIRCGQYHQHKSTDKGASILYLEDLFSVRYSRLLDAQRIVNSVSVEALGNFGRNLPAACVKLYRASGWIRTLLLKMELQLTRKVEDKSVARFDKCLLLSPREVQVIKSRATATNIHVIPPRMNSDFGAHPRMWDGNADFVFLGSLNLSHNAYGIQHFIEEEFSGLVKKIPNVRIFIIGAGASEELKRLVTLHEGKIKLMGFVDDIDDLLSRACAMISPLLFGSGMKLKIIDALRCGIPIVSTEIGIEGIEIASSVGVKIENSLHRFADAMQEYLDAETNEAASEANRKAFRRTYSRAVVDRAYDKLFSIQL